MEICFEGVGQVAATFQVSGEGVKPGAAVALTGSGTVGLGAAGKPPCGVVLGGVRGGAAAVQIGGVVKVGYSGGAAPAVGWQELVLDGEGGVRTADAAAGKTAESGLNCLVLAVDATAKTAVIKL